MPDNNSISIAIVNDVRVTVPASPQFLSTFVLQEQNDWFEDEIRFIRHYTKPGMKIVDIGANYGLYTLSFANIIGDSGTIWAFEPTNTTSAFLKHSIAENNFSNIELMQAGLSNRLGSAKLYLSLNSELNSLSQQTTSSDKYEEISLLTLDHCQQEFGWEHIDFIKLDAEGEEINILEGGINTLASLSPLIMFEIKHRDGFNLALVKNFKKLGYDCYRLIPGLNTLVPFDHDKPFDEYLLNLFCCKKDKAIELEDEGIIVRKLAEKKVAGDSLAAEYIGTLAFGEFFNGRTSIVSREGSEDYLEILNGYIMSLSDATNRSDRVCYLMGALNNLRRMIENGEQHVERLTTFARIAFDAGERTIGVQILETLINRYHKNINFEINELFLPAAQRYDSINPKAKLNEWLFSSFLEQFILKHAYSSYFSGQTILPIFAKLNELGFIGEDMRRRYQLLKNACSE